MEKRKSEISIYKNTIVKLLLLVAIMLVFIVLLTGMFKKEYGRIAERYYADTLKASDSSFDKTLGESIYTVRDALRALSTVFSGLSEQAYFADHSEMLQGVVDNTEAYGIYISDADGNILSGAGVQFTDTNGEWNEEALSGKEVMGVYDIKLHRPQGELFVLSCPVERDGKIAGTITAFLPMTVFTNASEANRTEWNSGHILLSKDGSVLAEGGFDSYEPGESLFDNSLFRMGSNMTADSFLSLMEKNKSGNMYCTLNGVRYYVRFAPVIDGRWYLMTMIDAEKRDKRIASEVARFSDYAVIFAIAFLIYVTLSAIVMYSGVRSANRSRSRLKHEAEKDLLTGVYNKLSTEKYIRRYMENDGSPAMFYIIDIDDFKNINDSYGHAFGDEVLKAVGKRLITEFRATDIIGRLGGDEFCVFLKNLSTEEEREKQAERMKNVFADISAGEHVRYNPTASIGGAEFPKYGTTFEEIYKAADLALYEVKKNGKNGISIYERKEKKQDQPG